jgi:AcrR family transcriptional regulator
MTAAPCPILGLVAKKNAHSGSRQAMILEAAKDLFFERSFAAVGVDEIGERAGVTGPAIYRHFRGKDEILSTLFDDAIDRLLEVTAVESDDPWEELEALVRGHARFVMGERKLAGVKIREERSLAEPYGRSLRRRERRYIDRWISCMERCYPDANPQDLSTAVNVALGALNSVAMWTPDALKSANAPEVLAAVVLHGLHSFQDADADAPATARAAKSAAA